MVTKNTTTEVNNKKNTHHHSHHNKGYKSKLILSLFSLFLILDLFYRPDLFAVSLTHAAYIRQNFASPRLD